jgi:hypothetical protein
LPEKMCIKSSLQGEGRGGVVILNWLMFNTATNP